MAFNLAMYPVSYVAQYNPETDSWNESWIQSDSITLDELMAMDESSRNAVYAKRNRFDLPW